jgi:RimJ/RimL family protein N-acetyltransferase
MYAAVRESLPELALWMTWCHPNYSIEEAREWVVSRQQLARDGAAHEFAIYGGGGQYLGGCGISQVNKAHRFANLGYWVRTSAVGRGVASCATRLAIEYAFEKTDLIRLEIVCAVANTRSQRVAERAGAVREGVLRNRLILPSGPSDAVMYSVVRPV